MQVKARGLAVLMLGLGLTINGLAAFGQGQGRFQPQTEAPPRPIDKKLYDIQADFVKKAELLAKEYAKNGKEDEARVVVEEILKITPRYEGALNILREIRTKEENAEDVTLDIDAKKGWQDTGVNLIPGKPIRITATGTWHLKLDHAKLSPEGIPVVKEARDLNFGSLIAIIDPGPTVETKGGRDRERERPKPFMIGASKEFTAQESGRLLMRMHDTDERDNEGKMVVTIKGTFAVDKKKKL